MQPPALEAIYLRRTELLENSRRVSLYCFQASQKHVVGNRILDQTGFWSDPQQIICCFTSSCPLRIIILFIKQAFGKEQGKKISSNKLVSLSGTMMLCLGFWRKWVWLLQRQSDFNWEVLLWKTEPQKEKKKKEIKL